MTTRRGALCLAPLLAALGAGPGCHIAAAMAGGEGLACADDSACPGTLACVAGSCQERPAPPARTPLDARAVTAGGRHSCALLVDGAVKCWGANDLGQLGQGDRRQRGSAPGEMGDALAAAALAPGHQVVALTAGEAHSCARLDDGSLRCWGANASGQLGLGDVEPRGDDPWELGDALPPVALGAGRMALTLASGYRHSCALLDDATVRCWGANDAAQLGLGDLEPRGDQAGEMGDALPPVALGPGSPAALLAAGRGFSCALHGDGSVRCFGDNASGALGLGAAGLLGDDVDEMGANLPPLDLDAAGGARALAAGAAHACALLDDGRVKCWGDNARGQLGLGDTESRGDGPGEMGAALPAVDLGAAAVVRALALGGQHSCALLDGGSLRCWGANGSGQLGLGDDRDRGDDPGEMGDALPAVDLGPGARVLAVSAGAAHTCALLDDGSLRCFGDNSGGQLGLGDDRDRGDEPDEMGAALPAVDLGSR